MGNQIDIAPTKQKPGISGFTWEVYILAFIITISIFGVGIFIGTNLSKATLSDMEQEIQSLNNKAVMLEVLSLASSDTEIFCSTYGDASKTFEEETWELGEKLDFLETQKGVYDAELKSTYSDLQFRDYLLVKQANERCNESINIIIYFYSNDNELCSECFEQGKELFEVRKYLISKNSSIRIYSFDGELDNSIIKVLKKRYKVSQYPTLIINGKSYYGFMNHDEILSKIG